MVTGIENNNSFILNQPKGLQNQDVNAPEKAGATANSVSEEPTNNHDMPHDKYTKASDRPEEPTGVYRLEEDKDGNKNIVLDDAGPTKKNDETSCVCNTDMVDAEIENIKEEKKQIEQQLKNTLDDEEKHKELEQRLSAVEAELKMKDSDNYRKQNASYTNSGAAPVFLGTDLG